MASRKRFRVRYLPTGGHIAGYNCWVYKPLTPKKLRMLTNFIKKNGKPLPLWLWFGGFTKVWGMPISDGAKLIRVRVGGV